MSVYPVLAIALCNMAALRASKVLVTLFGIELGANPFTIGVLVALYALFPMVLALHVGRIADRVGVRGPMIWGSLGVTCGLCIPFFWPSLTGLYASAALIGASYVFYHVCVQSLIGTLSSQDDRTRNFANYALVLSVAGFMGPLAAGFGIDWLGHTRAYLVLAAVPFAPVLILLALGSRVPAPHVAAEGAGTKRAADLWRDPELRRVFLMSAVVLTGIDLYQFYLPIYGHSIGLSATVIGMVLAMFSAAAFLVRTVMPPLARATGEEALLRYGLAIGAAGFVLVPFFENPLLLGAVSFFLGLGLGCSQPLTTLLTYAHSPAGRTGEALGLRLAINNSVHVVVPLAFGSLGAAFGVVPVFAVNSLLLFGGTLLSQRASRGRSRRR
jgi:MFS family permease